MRRSESLQKLGCRVQDVLRSTHSNGALGRIGGDELDLEYGAQHIDQILQLLLGARVRHIEGAQAHAVIEAMVLGGIGGHQNLFFLQRGPERLGDCAREPHGQIEAQIVDVETHAPADDGIFDGGGDAVRARDLGEQLP